MNTDDRDTKRKKALHSGGRCARSTRTRIFVIGGLIASMAWPVLSGCVVIPPACTASVEPAVSVTLTDEAGAPISGAVLTLTSGDFTEVMRELGDGRYTGADERSGTYDLSITADGFAPQSVEDIVAAAAICHVVTADVQLTLSAVSD